MAGSFEGWQLRMIRCSRAEPCPPTSIRDVQLVGFVVFVRASETEWGDRAQDQLRIDGMELFVINTECCHLRRRIVMNENISPCDEMSQRLLLLWQIKSDTALVGIQIEKEATFLCINLPTRKWTSLTRPIAARLFHFDHVCAKIGHEFGRIRCGHHVAEFKNFYSFQPLHV